MIAQGGGGLLARMMRPAYRAAWYPVLPFVLVATGARERSLRRERLGHLEFPAGRVSGNGRRVWVHASSVGEIEAVRPVLARLRREIARLEIVLTTMTTAGRAAGARRIADLAACQLAPFDCARAVRSFLEAVRPSLVLIAETELWPNFFWESAARGARIAIVNGRLSARALARYRYARPLFADVLAHCDLILAQSGADAARFRQLGASTDRLIITGNTKYDLEQGASPLRAELMQFADGGPLLIAGSTGPGEEPLVLAAYLRLRAQFPALKLAIAPRHLARIPQVEAEIAAARVEYVKATASAHSDREAPARPPILLLDTMGELRALYRRGTIAFVGGSLHPPRGGQSLAEPASASAPVLFGPHYENQQEIGDALIGAGGGLVIRDAVELETACAEWLRNDSARREAGNAARRAVERLAHGANQTVEHLRRLMMTDEAPATGN